MTLYRHDVLNTMTIISMTYDRYQSWGENITWRGTHRARLKVNLNASSITLCIFWGILLGGNRGGTTLCWRRSRDETTVIDCTVWKASVFCTACSSTWRTWAGQITTTDAHCAIPNPWLLFTDTFGWGDCRAQDVGCCLSGGKRRLYVPIVACGRC